MTERSVLLVEDDESLAWGMGELLREMDLQVRRVTRLETAIELVAHQRFDLIITDLLVVGGEARRWGHVENLRTSAGTTPILVVSALGGAVEEGHHRGFQVLAKPFDVEELETLARALLDGG